MIIITYEEFINDILETRGRFNCGDEYHERHHIVPKSCGGTNDKDNLIDLYAREHFIAHKLLSEENPNNASMAYAYATMSFTMDERGNRYRLTAEEYEESKLAFSNFLKNRYKDKNNHPTYGTHISDDRKKKIGEVNKGNKYCVGRVVTDETRRKIGDANRNPSQETRKKMSDSRKGKGVGASNNNAKPVIRLSDGKIYGCAKDAATENNINYSTLKGKLRRNNTDFVYYNEWLEKNILENNIC